jgi:Fe-S cluster assembly ATP-binding protein
MGPNGSGKSTLSYVLSGKDGYDITGGSMHFDGQDLADIQAEERAIAGLFLAFQYPLEIPGVTNMTFLKTALNAVRRGAVKTTWTRPAFCVWRAKNRGLWAWMTIC